MRLHELENTLPNGFHDSYLVRLVASPGQETVSLLLDIDLSDADEPSGLQDYRRAEVRLDGARLLSDGPTSKKEQWFSSCDPSDNPRIATFFLEDDNVFVSVEHESATLVWLDEPRGSATP